MVKPLDTLVADAAMPRPISPDYFTIGAEHHWVENFHHVHEFDALGPLYVARILAKAQKVQKEGQSEDTELTENQNQLVVIEREEV